MLGRNQLARFWCRVAWYGWRGVLAYTLVLLLAACGSRTAATDNDDLQISLLPAAVGVGSDIVRVQLHDREQAPITDATLMVEGNMNHAGMAPIMAGPISDGDDGAIDGIYQASLPFSMLGDWIITVVVTLADGSETTQDIQVTITEGGIQSSHDASGGEVQGTDALTVQNVLVRAVPVAGGNGAIYFTLTNHTNQADRLVAVESAVAATAEMHESVDDNTIIRMAPRPDGFELAPGATLVLAPGGKHVMLVQLKQSLVEGNTLPITLRFEHAPPITVTASIVGLGSDIVMEHSDRR
jgi:periplasmic copper chaperone A